MVGKIVALMLALIFLVSVPASALAAECGDGRCDAGEDCETCTSDCGQCNGALCISDNSCASNICCNGVCKDSCIVYSSTREQGMTGLFLTSPIGMVFFEIGLIVAVAAVILLLLRKRGRIHILR